MPFGVEINTYLNDRQAGACETRGIILEVDLSHGCLRRTIDFKLEEIDL